MNLVDPAPFLDKVDREVYLALTRKSRQPVEPNHEEVIYTEPRISKLSPEKSPTSSNLATHPEQQEEEWIITSKIQNLGSFIDTDAVRTSHPIHPLSPN